jgi:hypothetical protein
MGFIKLKKIFLFKLMIIFFVSLIPVLWIIQETPKVQKKIAEKLIDLLQNEWNARIAVKSYKINFFTGKIFLKGGNVKAFNNSEKYFFWTFDKAKVSFARLDYFFKDYFLMDVDFYNVKANSAISANGLDIKDHMKKIVLQDSALGGRLRSFNVNGLSLNINFNDKNIFINLPGKLGVKKFGTVLSGQHWSGFLFLENGQVKYDQKILIKDLNLQSVFSESDFTTNNIVQNLKGNFNFLENNYIINGLKNCIKINDEDNSINLKINFSKKDFFAELVLLNTGLPFFKDTRFKASIDLNKNQKIKLTNLDKIYLLNSLCIDPQKLDLNFELDEKFNIKGNYVIDLYKNNIEKQTFLCRGNCLFLNNELKTSGYIAKDYFSFDFLFDDFFKIKRLLYLNGSKKLLNLYSSNKHQNVLIGYIDISFLRLFFPYSINRYILGKNSKFFIELDQNVKDIFSGHVLFKGSKLAVLRSYNPINLFKFSFLYDKNLKRLSFNDFFINLSKGRIYSKSSIEIGLNNSFEVSYLNMPIELNDVLINWKNDFYAILDGYLLFAQKESNQTDVTGNIVLKNSLLKENLFNIDKNSINNYYFLLNPIKPNKNVISFNVDISNLNPINVNTDFANLKLSSDLNLKFSIANDKIFNPELTGTVITQKGDLDFLQHKLFIDYGKLQFVHGRFNDPNLDLIAKNRINKYFVTLHVTGSLNNPKIILKSFPKLKKKQILALLVAGSKEASFKANVSQILQRNLGQLNTGNSLFKKIIQPFRFVQITPSFANQRSKGGLKGTLDIDLNDQLHTSIQKNFNLQDDLSFQVDYFVSDDINFQFLKDQRGELGAQVEVRLTL